MKIVRHVQQFREKHTKILKENVDKLQSQSQALISQHAAQQERIRRLTEENEILRRQLQYARDVPISSNRTENNHGRAQATSQPLELSPTRIDELPDRSSNMHYPKRPRLKQTNNANDGRVHVSIRASALNQRQNNAIVGKTHLLHDSRRDADGKFSDAHALTADTLNGTSHCAAYTKKDSPSAMMTSTAVENRSIGGANLLNPRHKTHRLQCAGSEMSRSHQNVENHAYNVYHANCSMKNTVSTRPSAGKRDYESYRLAANALGQAPQLDDRCSRGHHRSETFSSRRGLQQSLSVQANRKVHPGSLSRFARNSRAGSVAVNPLAPSPLCSSGIVPRPSARFKSHPRPKGGYG